MEHRLKLQTDITFYSTCDRNDSVSKVSQFAREIRQEGRIGFRKRLNTSLI